MDIWIPCIHRKVINKIHPGQSDPTFYVVVVISMVIIISIIMVAIMVITMIVVAIFTSSAYEFFWMTVTFMPL